MFEVICINDSNRPDGIPIPKWVKKGNKYTVIKMDHLNVQNRILGFQLEEIDLSDCFPITYFLASRFVPISDLDKEAEEKVKQLLEESLITVHIN